MITFQHWFVAIFFAASIHVATMALWFAQDPQKALPLVEISGIDIGLSDIVDVENTAADSEINNLPPLTTPIVKSLPAVLPLDKTPEPIEPVVDVPVEVETVSSPIPDNEAVVFQKEQVLEAPEPKMNALDTVERDVSDSVAQESSSSVSQVSLQSEKKKVVKVGSRSGRSSNNTHSLRGYYSDLAALIDANKDYPGEVKKEKQEGTVIVNFAINRQGWLLSSAIHKSSGYPLLDKAALATLERSNPFPPIPKSIDRDILKIAVPISYTLITN